MKQIDIQIALAEIDGYTNIQYNNEFVKKWWGNSPVGVPKNNKDKDNPFRELPDYPNDRNAVAEFKKKHIKGHLLACVYATHLLRIIRREFDIHEELCIVDTVILASKLENIFDCEALIKTLDLKKWKE